MFYMPVFNVYLSKENILRLIRIQMEVTVFHIKDEIILNGTK